MQPPPEGSVVVLTFDGKGVVLYREDLREATCKAAERRRQHKGPLSRFKRLKPGEKKLSKRMAMHTTTSDESEVGSGAQPATY